LPSPSEPLLESLSALSQFFVADRTLTETLQRVVDLSVVAVPHADFSGLTTSVDRQPATPVFSDPEAARIDEVQYRAGAGPCLDSFREGKVFRIDDTNTETRWPAFCAAARDHGVHSTLSLPVVAGDQRLGALNLYGRTCGRFSKADADTGAAFATQAAIVLSNAHAYWDARSLAENLKVAMTHRAVIEQAKGILMATTGGLSADEAFELLVRASQRENRKLRDVAADLVARRNGHSQPDPQ
jgi:GAF domain-containing protein